MKILLTGGSGQLGKSIYLKKPKDFELISMSKKDLNICDKNACENVLSHLKPDWVINAAAYTAVDEAEENIRMAFEVNSNGPKNLSLALKKFGGCLLHISTDFVFDGKTKFPYLTNNKVNPINVYGKSKLAGEEIIESILGGTRQSIIIRTSWLMSPFGKNFLLTIFNLLKIKKEISVVSDQIGSPTSCDSLAEICWETIKIKNSSESNYLPGVMHWSNYGEVSWYQIANLILKVSKELNLISNNPIIKPIRTNQYKFKAKRPKYSVLDSSLTSHKLGLSNITWEEAIKNILYYMHKNDI